MYFILLFISNNNNEIQFIIIESLFLITIYYQLNC